MKCEVAQEWMVMLAYDELAEADATELEMHLRFCEACTADMKLLSVFQEAMAVEDMEEPSANLLAQSRMRLDARLDEAGVGGWMDRVRALVMGSVATVSSAPALATLLVGVGFLSGNFLERYQARRGPAITDATVNMNNQTESVISNVSGIVQTPNSNIVQVKYNRVVPETMQGSLDDPKIRELLMVGAKNGISNGVRENSVSLLAQECIAGHQCESASGGGVGVRDALLVSLRYDKSPKVRMKALEGLQPYVGADQRVRDAVAESLMRDASADVRTRAIDLLQPVQADSSIRQVLHTVSTRDENPYIRNASTQALEGTDGLQ